MQGGQDQLDWLQFQLNSAEEGQTFILVMHIFPGLFYMDQKTDEFWYRDPLVQFNQILANNSEKVLFVIGAHIHFADVRAPMMDPGNNYIDPKTVFLISPSISPVFRNNPGYSVIDLDLT